MLGVGTSEDTVAFLNPATDTYLHTRPVTHTEPWPVVAFPAPGGGSWVAVAGGGTVRLWDPHNGYYVVSLDSDASRVSAVAAVPVPGAATLLAVADPSGLTLWDVAAEQRTGWRLTDRAADVRSLTAVPVVDGTVLCAAGDDGRVRLWRIGRDLRARPLGTVVNGRDGWAFLAADGRTYRAVGEVGDVLWWAVRLARFEAGELDRHEPALRRLADGEPFPAP
jgi:WD40 repeat protein